MTKIYKIPPISPEWRKLPLETQLRVAEAIQKCTENESIEEAVAALICGNSDFGSILVSIVGHIGMDSGIKTTCRGIECRNCVADSERHIEDALKTNQLKLTEIFNYDDLDS